MNKPWLKIYKKLKGVVDGDTDLMHMMDSSGTVTAGGFADAKAAAWVSTCSVSNFLPGSSFTESHTMRLHPYSVLQKWKKSMTLYLRFRVLRKIIL